MAKISQWQQSDAYSPMNPNHYPDPTEMMHLSGFARTGDRMLFSQHVGGPQRGYNVRVSLEFEEVRDFYRNRLQESDQRLADEIAFLSARLAARMVARSKKDAA